MDRYRWAGMRSPFVLDREVALGTRAGAMIFDSFATLYQLEMIVE